MIQIWKDNIMGNKPLEQNNGLLPLKTWMERNKLNTYFDISSWFESFGCWIGLSIGSPPSHLIYLTPKLLGALKGCARYDINTLYRRGWGALKSG
jgi:hypothetical protein